VKAEECRYPGPEWCHHQAPSTCKKPNTYKLQLNFSYNIMNGTEYFVSLQTSVVLTEKYKVLVKSDESIGTTECDVTEKVSLKLMSL
jgi:hypothetical protein